MEDAAIDSRRGVLCFGRAAYAQAVFDSRCTPKWRIRARDCAEVALIRGWSGNAMVEKAQTVFEQFCGLNSEIRASADEEIDAQNGPCVSGRIDNAHAKFDRCMLDALSPAATSPATVPTSLRNWAPPSTSGPSGLLATRWSAVTKWTVLNCAAYLSHMSSTPAAVPVAAMSSLKRRDWRSVGVRPLGHPRKSTARPPAAAGPVGMRVPSARTDSPPAPLH
mmetsp:Transcript_13077/g.37115  ORF Transcript_13077/g.37115 Transcript_13077/m.37115 type:complete len:221 (+) Transcript_13077:642-1304(+)